MTGIKPSSHGIVVDHKESGTRYAISDKNYDEKVHRKVRDLRAGETVLGYQPKRREQLSGGESPQSGTGTAEQADGSALNASEGLADGSAGTTQATQTEGANTGTQEKKGK